MGVLLSQLFTFCSDCFALVTIVARLEFLSGYTPFMEQ